MDRAPAPTPGWLLLVNRDAGDQERDLACALADDLGAEVRTTASPDEVDDVVRACDGRTLVVCGGDGSVRLAVARCRALGALADTTLAIVPMGTGNDLAGHLGIPEDAAGLGQMLRAGRTRSLDLLLDETDAVIVNALHAGIGVDAARRATGFKRALGNAAYPLGAVAAGVRARALDVRVEVDGRRLDSADGVLMVVVANGHTVGGGAPVAPDADAGDGLLDVVVSHAHGPAARVAYGVALARGRHLERDDVLRARGRAVVVEGTDLAWNADGELGDATVTSRRVRVDPGAWRVVVPPEAA